MASFPPGFYESSIYRLVVFDLFFEFFCVCLNFYVII
jgi:hypothetical protein